MDKHTPTHTGHAGSGDAKATAMQHGSGGGGHYGRFAWMLVLSFAAMYVLMYAMVDRLGNAVPNINQFYMAGLMTAPMAILEILLMGRMYPDKRKNMTILLMAAGVLAVCWVGIRAQAGVGDRQFLKSMIPHHAGAILMCEQAKLTKPDVRVLCEGIVKAQEEEIAQMRALLAR
jgi:hypothetical protein